MTAVRARLAGVRGSQRQSERLRQVAILVLLGLGAIVMILPFEWMFATSLSRAANTGMPRTPTLWPADPSTFNYYVAASNLPVIRYYLNSIVVVGLATIGYLFFSSITGYAFAKGRFPGRTAFFLLFLVTLLVPFEIRIIPLYLLMRDLNLNDTIPALILPFIVGGFGTFLMRQYITTLPDDLIDAARLDGASEFAIYRYVILPLCVPVLAALAIITIIWRWNDILWPLIAITDRDLYTVTLGLAMAGRSQGIFTGVALATAALALIPIIIVYLALQRHIIRGIALTGMKG